MISTPLAKCWASPPATFALATVVESGAVVYSVTSGGLGLSKFGPTAQAVTSIEARADVSTLAASRSTLAIKEWAFWLLHIDNNCS